MRVDYNERQGEREKNIGDKFKQHFGAKEGKRTKERKKERKKVENLQIGGLSYFHVPYE